MFARLGRLIGYLSDTRWRTFLAAAVCGVAFGGIEVLVHFILRRTVLPLRDLVAVDASVVGLAGAVTVWVLLKGNRARRLRVRVELERIAELNHEVRNALQVISHSHFDARPEHRDMVFQSVDRIDAALRRLFPAVGGTADGVAQTQRRTRTRQSSQHGQW